MCVCKRKSEYVCVYETEREKEREVIIPASLVFNRGKKTFVGCHSVVCEADEPLPIIP